MSRKRVAIVRGGPSSEFAVSMRTGSSILEHIDKSKYEPLDIIITRSGSWLYSGVERKPESILSTVDVVCNALHGSYGEDGTIQRFLDRLSVPYTGSKALASSIAMNKILTKECLSHTVIKTAPHIRVRKDSLSELGTIVHSITSSFGPEYVIKPISSGSSHGTCIVHSPAELYQTLMDMLSDNEELMVEKRIRGREATCGIIEKYRHTPYYALPPIEIIIPSQSDFFDATVKYDGTTRELCPSHFHKDIKDAIMDAAILVHKTLNLAQYSRSDFIVAKDGIYFLEVNTLPGLTSESLFPKAIKAVGGSYTDFISHILEHA